MYMDLSADVHVKYVDMDTAVDVKPCFATRFHTRAEWPSMSAGALHIGLMCFSDSIEPITHHYSVLRTNVRYTCHAIS